LLAESEIAEPVNGKRRDVLRAPELALVAS
jgi:hypothetical protein